MSRHSRTALSTCIDASRKSTSVRGSITSRSCRSPTSSTSSTMRRSSMPRDSLAMTMLRSSSAEISSRLTVGSPPSSRTTTSVERESNQITGRMMRATNSTTGATAGRCPRALQGEPFWSQLGQHEGEERDDDGDRDQRHRTRERLGDAPVDQDGLEAVGQRRGAERGRQEPGERDPHLECREEGVRAARPGVRRHGRGGRARRGPGPGSRATTAAPARRPRRRRRSG